MKNLQPSKKTQNQSSQFSVITTQQQNNQTQYMKRILTLKPFGLSLAALALAGLMNTGQAAVLTDSITNTFPTGGNTNYFTGAVSLAGLAGMAAATTTRR